MSRLLQYSAVWEKDNASSGLAAVFFSLCLLVDSEWVIGFPTALLRNLAAPTSPLKQRGERIGRKVKA